MKKFAVVVTKDYLLSDHNLKCFEHCLNWLNDHSCYTLFSSDSAFSLSQNIVSLSELNTEQFEAILAFSSETDNQTLKDAKNIILNFHKKSKPIAAISLASLTIADFLKPHNPWIALPEDLTAIEYARQLKIQYELCPASDYISDRDCKLLSNVSDLKFEKNLDECLNGLKLLLKEFWEIS
jgi:enhancing lycopene biosynthesis protein 2